MNSSCTSPISCSVLTQEEAKQNLLWPNYIYFMQAILQPFQCSYLATKPEQGQNLALYSQFLYCDDYYYFVL